MVARVCFPEQGKVAVEDYDPGRPGPGQVRVRALASLLSNGTEGILLHRRFAPGSHWDGRFQGCGGYPWRPGYALVGEVVEAGADAGLAVGTRVGLRSGHAAEVVAGADACRSLPAGLDPVLAAWFGLAKITCIGARAAGAVLGEPVVVMVADGRIDMTGLTTHIIPGGQAPRAYAAITDDPARTLGVALDWTKG